MAGKAIYVRLQPKPGKSEAVREFLASALSAVENEEGTRTWFALDEGDAFSIFDTFDDESGRDAHLGGAVAKALMAKADELLAEPPQISKIDIVAKKVG